MVKGEKCGKQCTLRLIASARVSATTMCSGRRILDTSLDEYIRLQEVLDEQTTAYLPPPQA